MKVFGNQMSDIRAWEILILHTLVKLCAIDAKVLGKR